MSQSRRNDLVLAKFKKKFKVKDNLEFFLTVVAEAWDLHTKEEKEWDKMVKQKPRNYEGDYDPSENFGSYEDKCAYYAYQLFEHLSPKEGE